MPGMLEERRFGLKSPIASRAMWHWLFYVLVGFDLFTVLVSLFLNDTIMRIYVQSIATNHAWVECLHETARLGQLAAQVNAPGNDVFQTNQVDTERENMRKSRDAFYNQLSVLQEKFKPDPSSNERNTLSDSLRTVEVAIQAMIGEEERLFDSWKDKRPLEAGKRMAAMDRHFSDVNKALARVNREIHEIQERQFDRQAAAAASVQRTQGLMAALIVLMIAGAFWVGQKIRRSAEKNQEAHVRELLLKQTLVAQEDERRRIARDLHDEIGQALTSVLIGLRTAAETPDLETMRERTSQLRQIALAALEEVRRLARGLRPSVLDDLGLIAALEHHAAEYGLAQGVAVEIQATPAHMNRLDGETEIALYRIVQEALANVARHASAKKVRITIARQTRHIEIDIRDDGRGFDNPGEASSDGLGLVGMRERAALLGGRLTVTSQIGGGTIVSVRIPLLEEEHGQDTRVAGG